MSNSHGLIYTCAARMDLFRSTSKEGQGTVTGSIGPHIAECYRLAGGADPDDQVSLYTRNSGEDRVVVRLSRMMGEMAKKDHFTSLDPVDQTR